MIDTAQHNKEMMNIHTTDTCANPRSRGLARSWPAAPLPHPTHLALATTLGAETGQERVNIATARYCS